MNSNNTLYEERSNNNNKVNFHFKATHVCICGQTVLISIHQVNFISNRIITGRGIGDKRPQSVTLALSM